MLRILMLMLLIIPTTDLMAQRRPPECNDVRLNPRLYELLCKDAPGPRKEDWPKIRAQQMKESCPTSEAACWVRFSGSDSRCLHAAQEAMKGIRHVRGRLIDPVAAWIDEPLPYWRLALAATIRTYPISVFDGPGWEPTDVQVRCVDDPYSMILNEFKIIPPNS